jgi:hypothetical protein
LIPPDNVTVYIIGATQILDGQTPEIITFVRTPDAKVGVQV